MDIKQRMQELAQAKYGREPAQCGDGELYHVLLQLTQELAWASSWVRDRKSVV